jgi:hypothetical protein
MAWGNAAPRGWPDQDTLDPTELSLIYPYKQIFFPAGIMTGSINKEPTFQALRIASQDQAFDVWTFPNTDPEKEVHFVWAINKLEINVAALEIIAYPVWLQSVDAAAPAPTEHVLWTIAIGNRNRDGDLNFNMDPGTGEEVDIQSPVLDQWHVAGGDTSNVQAGGRITTLTGTNPASAGNWNLLQFMVERQSQDVLDTYANEAHLLGVAIQYKTNFNNVAQWSYV